MLHLISSLKKTIFLLSCVIVASGLSGQTKARTYQILDNNFQQKFQNMPVTDSASRIDPKELTIRYPFFVANGNSSGALNALNNEIQLLIGKTMKEYPYIKKQNAPPPNKTGMGSLYPFVMGINYTVTLQTDSLLSFTLNQFIHSKQKMEDELIVYSIYFPHNKKLNINDVLAADAKQKVKEALKSKYAKQNNLNPADGKVSGFEKSLGELNSFSLKEDSLLVYYKINPLQLDWKSISIPFSTDQVLFNKSVVPLKTAGKN